MQEDMISHPRLSVRRRTGSEGPSHDPYAFEELEVFTPNGVTIFHMGLGVWLKYNGHLLEPPLTVPPNKTEEWLSDIKFRACTGYSLIQLERIARKLKERCRKCGGKDRHHERGMPGEHLAVCDNCGNIVGGYFSESEII